MHHLHKPKTDLGGVGDNMVVSQQTRQLELEVAHALEDDYTAVSPWFYRANTEESG